MWPDFAEPQDHHVGNIVVFLVDQLRAGRLFDHLTKLLAEATQKGACVHAPLPSTLTPHDRKDCPKGCPVKDLEVASGVAGHRAACDLSGEGEVV
jgi:hypothetical protein